jgi:hypothetical protein
MSRWSLGEDASMKKSYWQLLVVGVVLNCLGFALSTSLDGRVRLRCPKRRSVCLAEHPACTRGLAWTARASTFSEE